MKQTGNHHSYGDAVSLDGFLVGVDSSIDWLHFSPDVQEVMDGQDLLRIVRF